MPGAGLEPAWITPKDFKSFGKAISPLPLLSLPFRNHPRHHHNSLLFIDFVGNLGSVVFRLQAKTTGKLLCSNCAQSPGMPSHILTVKEIRALQPGKALSDGGPHGAGSLWFKCSRAGTISCVFRYSVNRKVMDWSLGLFDETGKLGLSLVKARAKAGDLSRLIQAGIPDPRAHLAEQDRLKAEAEARAEAEAAAAVEFARRAEEDQRRFTLKALLDAYTDHLERIGKVQAARDARSLFRVNIFTPAPELATTPAKLVTKADLATRIRAIRETGKERAAGKTRSYLFAAYNLALRAEGDTQAPAALIPFQIEHNPVAGIKAIPVKAGDRTLNLEELRAFIGKLEDCIADDAIRLAVYAGGQRPQQVLRLKISDFDPQTDTLRLLDPKGRRAQPREHRLPLAPVAAGIVKALVTRAREVRPDDADPLLFTSRGDFVVSLTTLSKRVTELSTAMGGASFNLRDLRRSVETELASMGVSVDIRAQLLSHGLGGVQARHYDRHSYAKEKGIALERWERHLDGKEENGKVVKLRRRG